MQDANDQDPNRSAPTFRIEQGTVAVRAKYALNESSAIVAVDAHGFCKSRVRGDDSALAGDSKLVLGGRRRPPRDVDWSATLNYRVKFKPGSPASASFIRKRKLLPPVRSTVPSIASPSASRVSARI
jgi:hypothetical protein